MQTNFHLFYLLREVGFRVSMLRRASPLLGWHYVHPMNGRPVRFDDDYKNPAYINNEVALIKGQWGLITSDFGIVSQSQLENARLAILKRMPRDIFTLHVHTDYQEIPQCPRPREQRQGRGMPAIHHFAFKFTTGIPLFELIPIHKENGPTITRAMANGIFLSGRMFIPVDTVVVPQGRVHEYSVFK